MGSLMIHQLDHVYINAPVAKIKKTLNETRGMSEIHRSNHMITVMFDTITYCVKSYLVDKMTKYHYGIK